MRLVRIAKILVAGCRSGTLFLTQPVAGFSGLSRTSSASLGSKRTHELELKVIAPITVLADRNEIALRLPMAFESELTLQVPQIDTAARVPRGGEPRIERTESGSAIRLENLDRDFSLRWWETSHEDISARVIVDEQLFTWLDPIRQLVRHDLQFNYRR